MEDTEIIIDHDAKRIEIRQHFDLPTLPFPSSCCNMTPTGLTVTISGATMLPEDPTPARRQPKN